MEKRPYFKSSIVELEQIFETSKNDIKILQALHHELEYRNTNRAKQLHMKIEKLINIPEVKSSKDSKSQSKIAETKEKAEIEHQVPIYAEAATIEERDPINELVMPQFETKTESLEVDNSLHDFSSRDIFRHKKSSLVTQIEISNPGPDPILAAWLTIEVLTPQPLPNIQDLESLYRKLIRLEDNPEPWKDKRNDKRGKEKDVYWMIYLGELNLSKALHSILKLYPDENIDEHDVDKGNTTLAVIVLDSLGRPVQDRTFLSSFAWGYGKVRAGQLKDLASFVNAEINIKSGIERLLIRQNEDGEILPVDFSDIQRITDWLIKELNLPEDEIIRPGVAIRVPQYSWYQEAPEPELLNSFFIEDLVRVRTAFVERSVGKALLAYMGINTPKVWRDVVYDQDLLKETLAPDRMPFTRWPGRGRYPLYLMQQAAINHSVKELANGGLVGINGPPGTGKTTLLRDVVAKVVLDRAIAMSKFDKPELAFKHLGSMKTGGAYTHLYQLDESLLGYEIVVASSNNKAVENISREIPNSKAIADDFTPPLRYFQTISDNLSASDGQVIEGETWGLAAAVLGNSANRNAFIKSFWWDKQRGMYTYLAAIIGANIDNDNKNDEDDQQPDNPIILELEKPPCNEIEALERWKIARKDFNGKLKKVQELQKRAQKAYEAVIRKPDAVKRSEEALSVLTLAKQELVSSEERLNDARLHSKNTLEAEKKAVEDRSAFDRMRPGFFARLFQLRAYRDWIKQMAVLMESVTKARDEIKRTSSDLNQAQSEFNAAKEKLTRSEMEKLKADQALDETLTLINEGRKLIGDNFADESYWSCDEEKLQLGSPWVFTDLQRARDDLFAAAFALHRAFIDGAAKIMRHNLRAALEIMKGRPLSEKQELARRSLWGSLFLVVPVLSTTFASTSRLFGKLGAEQLGWLLIDEAGQATPQAAIGAIWRAKRAIVIGDPLQIEPVVTIPPKLINTIFSQFGVFHDEWAAPAVSAQSLADRVSWFGTSICSADGDIWVGSPLRVHRRCEQPMFSISNYIAYNGLMVYGTPEGISPIGNILGPSVWINVEGSSSERKWSKDEGEIVLKLLERLFTSGIQEPDIFFITPFRIVSYKLREIIRNNHQISKRLPQKAWEWTNERVGTIHTFQGKEADTVVLVLGAPLEFSAGARRWAGGSPNLLNVAVTRAKRRIYVIGNHRVWKNEGHFSILARSLQLRENL
jgi:hypothetical protein